MGTEALAAPSLALEASILLFDHAPDSPDRIRTCELLVQSQAPACLRQLRDFKVGETGFEPVTIPAPKAGAFDLTRRIRPQLLL